MRKTKMARINVYNITISQDRPKPYRLKWTVDGRHKSRNFKTLGEAEKFKVKLESAVEDGFLFDPNSGLPDQWVKQLRGYADVASEYSATKWHEWSAISRASFCDAAAVILFELIRPNFKEDYTRAETLKVIRNFILNQNKSKPTERDLEIKNHVIKKSYRLKEITPEIVFKTIQLASHKEDGSVTAKDTQRKRKQSFGAVMDYAYRQNYIKDNSFKRVKVKRIPTLEPLDPFKALNPAECRTYCQILRNHAKIKQGSYMEVADFLEIIWLAGLRPSEVAGLQVKHIHFLEDKTSYIKVEQAVVSVSAGYADDLSTQEKKGLKARSRTSFRTVPILEELKPTLARLIESKDRDDFLFTSPKEPNKPMKTELVARYFKKVCNSNHSPYDLRHTNASILIYSGLNIIDVASRLGNSIDVCQKVYLHLINRVEEVSIAKENKYLQDSKDPLSEFLAEFQIGVIYPPKS